MLAEHPTASGPFNICCPDTPTNAEFTHAFARAVHAGPSSSAPLAVLRVAAGPTGPGAAGSLNIRPAALETLGFEFADRDIEAILSTALA